WPQWKFRLDRRPPGSARRPGRRSTRALVTHTARPRLVQLEDRDLTGNMLALEAALVNVPLVQPGAEPPALVAPEKPGFSEKPGFGERASDGAFAVDYNISTVESAAWKLDAADTAVEARPAMTHFLFENPEQPEELPPPQPERPLTDPLQPELADP